MGRYLNGDVTEEGITVRSLKSFHASWDPFNAKKTKKMFKKIWGHGARCSDAPSDQALDN